MTSDLEQNLVFTWSFQINRKLNLPNVRYNLVASHDIIFSVVCTDYTGYCPDTCTGLFNPVCGRDGKVYLNRCQLFKKACATNNDWLYEVINRTCFDGMFILIRFIVNSKISQIWCIVELERGQNVSHSVFCCLFNPAIHQICDILLLAINLMFILNICYIKWTKWQKPSCFTCLIQTPLFLKHCGIGHLKTRLLPDLKLLENVPHHSPSNCANFMKK